MGKIVGETLYNGETVVKVATTLQGTAPYAVRTFPGVGKPFWYWDTVPAGKIVGADFTGAPIATSDVAVNASLIAGITARPQDVLIYDPPLV
jgi:hypothetical protein